MEKPDLLLSFLTSKSIYSRWNWGICGRAELCFVVRIFFSFSFFFFSHQHLSGIQGKKPGKGPGFCTSSGKRWV